MFDLLTIALEAHSDERNHHRRYEVSVGRDLLEHWVVTVRYGRVGKPLRELRYGSASIDTAREVVNDRLRQRVSAPKRIGCAYRLRGFDSATDFDCALWVPTAILGQLLP